MIQLRKMEEEEFEDFKAYAIEEYALEMSQDYDIDIEAARKSATEQANNRLAQGLATPGSFTPCRKHSVIENCR